MRRWVWLALVVGIALVIFLIIRTERADSPRPTSAAATDDASSGPIDRAGPGRLDEAYASQDLERDAEASVVTEEALLDRDFEIAVRWSRVDLDRVRAAMPDNLYWTFGAPTSDPAVERERAEERARWNREWGKVLSGNASEAEIEAYYAERYRLSADYVEFATHLLENYRGVLPARDVGLLELSAGMHHARLQEMPRRLAEATARKERQDRLREAWLQDEAAFNQAQAEEAERARR